MNTIGPIISKIADAFNYFVVDHYAESLNEFKSKILKKVEIMPETNFSKKQLMLRDKNAIKSLYKWNKDFLAIIVLNN